MMLNEYEAGAFHVLAGDRRHSKLAVSREAASGWVEENIGDTPRVLAHGIRQGCTIVWFARSSSGDIEARIGAVTPSDGVEIRLKNSCVWMMQQLSAPISRSIANSDGQHMDISAMVVKL